MRDYGIEPVVWDGEPGCDCEHEWNEEITIASGQSYGANPTSTLTTGTTQARREEVQKLIGMNTKVSSAFCRKCNAWLGSYGLEPSMELYIQHTVQIFREVRRVMRKDSTLFLNLGDSYAADRGGTAMPAETLAGGISGYGEEKTFRGRGKQKIGRRNCKTIGLKHKDLCGIPWRVAFALQKDGWWLRSDIIWAKPNPMPESCTDRPTKSHEYLFLLAKSGTNQYWTHRDKDGVRIQPKPDYRWIHIDTGEERTTAPAGWTMKDKKGWGRVNLWDGHDYFYDADAIREEHLSKPTNKITGRKDTEYQQSRGDPEGIHAYSFAGRNKRTVWTIATEPFPDAHFATFPRRLVAPCILAGTSEAGVCAECGAPWERMVKKEGKKASEYLSERGYSQKRGDNKELRQSLDYAGGHNRPPTQSTTIGWRPTCACNAETAHAVVLDPFGGSCTTAVVAKSLNRDYIMIELNPAYIAMAEKRISTVQPNLELI